MNRNIRILICLNMNRLSIINYYTVPFHYLHLSIFCDANGNSFFSWRQNGTIGCTFDTRNASSWTTGSGTFEHSGSDRNEIGIVWWEQRARKLVQFVRIFTLLSLLCCWAWKWWDNPLIYFFLASIFSSVSMF